MSNVITGFGTKDIIQGLIWVWGPEGSDIYRDISFGVNIEGFEAYRCIGVTLWG